MTRRNAALFAALVVLLVVAGVIPIRLSGQGSPPGIPLDATKPVQTAAAAQDAQVPAEAQSIPGFIGKPLAPPPMHIPDGFTPIFNGKDLTGWHISKTNHHGITPDYHVMHGMIVGTQNPLGSGGILLTDKKYKNLEVYMEVKPDWGCDSGLFFRSNEAGDAYQVTMDYLPAGSIGGIYGEGLQGVNGRGGNPASASASAPAPWTRAWKLEDWNAVRVRFTGEIPHITVWLNDQQITDFTDTANHAAGGITEGPIAIQVHGANRWVPGGWWRWRVIAVKELP